MGAAYLAGLAVGYWMDLADIQKNWAVDRCFDPNISEELRQQRLSDWKRAVNCATAWIKTD
jgi:glycerol kinase